MKFWFINLFPLPSKKKRKYTLCFTIVWLNIFCLLLLRSRFRENRNDSHKTGWRQQKIYNYLRYTKECLTHSSSGIRILNIDFDFKLFLLSPVLSSTCTVILLFIGKSAYIFFSISLYSTRIYRITSVHFFTSKKKFIHIILATQRLIEAIRK